MPVLLFQIHLFVIVQNSARPVILAADKYSKTALLTIDVANDMMDEKGSLVLFEPQLMPSGWYVYSLSVI